MALIDNRSSDLTDPLQHCSNDSDDLDSVHNLLKSTGLNDIDKLLDEARAVVNSEVLGSKLAPNGASENNNETVTKIKRNLEERRPGLGLKRSFCECLGFQMTSFCECLGFQMTRDTFMNHEQMYELGCLTHYDPDLVNRMNKNATTGELASQLKKLTGIHQVKVPINRAPTASETGTGTGAGSSIRNEGGGETQAPEQVENLIRIEEAVSPRVDGPMSKKQRIISKEFLKGTAASIRIRCVA